ncbi:MAG: type II toxin-antitoxin system HicB family antitoxin [Rhodospirillaceae bacterium]
MTGPILPDEKEHQVLSLAYPVNLEEDEDGRFVARCPDVQGCVTDGLTRAEALTEVADALFVALAAAKKAGRTLPMPSSAQGRPLVFPKALV